MKKEVSCRIVEGILEYLEKHNIPPETMCAGVPYTLDYLRNKQERIEWDAFCRIHDNLQAIWPDDEFEKLGYQILRSVPFRNAMSVVKLLFTGPEIYFWWTTNTRGPGKQLFDCISATIEQAAKNHIVITLTLPRGYRYCREFFVITKGSFAAGTTVIGLDPARVAMREIDGGAVYDIFCPEGGGTLSWLRRAVMWPFAARTAARELKEANETLHERYDQLEAAQTKIQRQATQLQIAFSIGEVIRSNLNLDATIDAVAQSLVEVAHFAAAKVVVCAKNNGDSLSRVVTKGVSPSSERHLTKTLEAHGQPIGELCVWLHADADLHEAEELLDQIAPSIAMEINDALSFTLLTEYRNRDKLIQQEFSRRQIESQEAERKRLAAELHDGLGQDLLVMNNDLQQFLQGRKEPNDELKQVASLLQESIEGVREIASNLHPHHLDRLGFCAAVEAMAENLSHSTGLVIRSSCHPIDRSLPKETEIHLYRIIQEALSNVVRHASAKNVTVHVKKNAESIEISVTDDGKGFDVEGAVKRPLSHSSIAGHHGFGLVSMNERVRIIGGTMKIESSPVSGTTVHVSFPVPESQ